MVQGAKDYARFDKSDPFALARAMTHIGQGLCAPLQDGRDSHYSADSSIEDGKIVYRNVVRP
jgi:hypothetical protein